MPQIRIVEAGFGALDAYCRIPMAFRVDAIASVTRKQDGSWRLAKVAVDEPWIKDYDALESPAELPGTFDLAHWTLFLAEDSSGPQGGCIVAQDTPGVDMLQGRRDLAVLWDIRIHPSLRGAGLGCRLFERACTWAGKKGCVELQVETQQINLPACRFYAAMGCRLSRVNREAYAECPGEDQLIWSLPLQDRL